MIYALKWKLPKKNWTGATPRGPKGEKRPADVPGNPGVIPTRIQEHKLWCDGNDRPLELRCIY
jgi:hypothetical protein